MKTTEIDLETGETTERDLTPEEQAQKQADAAAAQQADAAEATYTAERGDADSQLSAVRAKAKQVAAGEGTFTAAQTQKILAHLVLRASR